MPGFWQRLPVEKNLQERFVRETGDDFPGRVAHAHDLLPIFRRGWRSDRRADRDGDASGARQPRAVPQHAPRSVESDGHDLPLRRDGRFERAEMKWTHAGLRGEGSFRKNKNGFAAPQGVLNLFRLLQSRAADLRGETRNGRACEGTFRKTAWTSLRLWRRNGNPCRAPP